jgi:Domain of unknown function (DUF4390)
MVRRPGAADAAGRRRVIQLAVLSVLLPPLGTARAQEARADLPGERRSDASGTLPAVSSVELQQLDLSRDEAGQLLVSFQARLKLGTAVMDALRRGIPVHFVAQARLVRPRWWWRDAHIASVQRSWRLAYLPLTSNWRVSSTGGLAQTVASLPEALGWVSRAIDWPVAELSQLAPQTRHLLTFSYRLDTSQLPGPMQIGLTDQGDWDMAVERTVPVDPS